MKEMLKLGAVLACFAVVSCVALALVNGVTSPVIAAQKQGKTGEALKVVFPDAASFEKADSGYQNADAVQIQSLYVAKDSGGAVLGAVVQATGPTYDKAVILVGVTVSGSITATEILELSDTPGFGQKAKEGGYMDQYSGKSAADAFTVGADVVAISGATISSNGIASIVKHGTRAATEYLAGGK